MELLELRSGRRQAEERPRALRPKVGRPPAVVLNLVRMITGGTIQLVDSPDVLGGEARKTEADGGGEDRGGLCGCSGGL